MRQGAVVSELNKATVRRLIDEVLNGGRLEVIDELHAPELAPGGQTLDHTLSGQLPRCPHGSSWS
jgi:hypothetical protein